MLYIEMMSSLTGYLFLSGNHLLGAKSAESLSHEQAQLCLILTQSIAPSEPVWSLPTRSKGSGGQAEVFHRA